ncbi:MAG: redoxin family protein, partial [Haemophilus parainfluenzae]|nr:redoxin family protein [Haemophilus parainfluenzae]
MRKILTALLVFLSPLSFAQEKVSLADISLKTLDNQTVTLSQYQDKPLYIKMWASWCPICLAGLAEIDDLSAEKNLDFNVITIASPGQKNEQNSSKFINWYKGLDYKNITVLLDENGEIIKRANVLGYP